MKIYIDRPKVNGRATLANVMSVGGLLLLLASVVAPLFLPALAGISLLLLAAGGIIAMVGIYYSNRWIRKPRPEDSLDKALKAFDDNYRLYHYPKLPCDHVLLTPSGIVLMEVVNLAGSFSYRNGHWREAMTIGRALRYIVEPRVIDPVVVAEALQGDMKKWLENHLQLKASIPMKALTVFTHPATELEVQRPPFPACTIGKLRKQAATQGPKLVRETYERLASAFEPLTVEP
ncbi:MAG: nuclease-related domain-containing protein [Anaerolineales bacterium]|jgi:hypothetical protein